MTLPFPLQLLVVACLNQAWSSHLDLDTRQGELTQHEGDGDELDVAIAVESQLLKHHLLFLGEGHPGEAEWGWRRVNTGRGWLRLVPGPARPRVGVWLPVCCPTAS